MLDGEEVNHPPPVPYPFPRSWTKCVILESIQMTTGVENLHYRSKHFNRSSSRYTIVSCSSNALLRQFELEDVEHAKICSESRLSPTKEWIMMQSSWPTPLAYAIRLHATYAIISLLGQQLFHWISQCCLDVIGYTWIWHYLPAIALKMIYELVCGGLAFTELLHASKLTDWQDPSLVSKCKILQSSMLLSRRYGACMKSGLCLSPHCPNQQL